MVCLHKADVARSKTLLYTRDYEHLIRATLIAALVFQLQQKE